MAREGRESTLNQELRYFGRLEYLGIVFLSLSLSPNVCIYIYANPLASRHDPVCNQVWIEDYGNGELWNVMEMENHGDGES